MSSQENYNSARQDEAVSARLRALSTMPVDLSRLQARVEQEVPRRERHRPMVMRLFRQLRCQAHFPSFCGSKRRRRRRTGTVRLT